MTETEHGRTYEGTDDAHRRFQKRFPGVGEVLAKPREKVWKFALPVVCAVGISFALDYPVMEFLVPNVTAGEFPFPVDWLLENFALVGAACVAVAEGAMVAYAGKEAAWAWSPFLGDPQHLRDKGADEPYGVVHSDRSRAGHLVGFAVVAIPLVGLLVALVALREKALTLLSGLNGGGAAGGLAGSLVSATPKSGGLWTAVELFVISGFPLLVAGWAAFLHESPLTSTLAALVEQKKGAFKQLVRATKTRVALEDRLVALGVDLGLVEHERDADLFLARLYPHMVAEILAEASPGFYGVVSKGPHPLLWRVEGSEAAKSAEENLADMLDELRATEEALGPMDDIGAENGNGNHKAAV
jgi:hypothetical protein